MCSDRVGHVHYVAIDDLVITTPLKNDISALWSRPGKAGASLKPVLHGDMCISCSIKIWWMAFLVMQNTWELLPGDIKTMWIKVDEWLSWQRKIHEDFPLFLPGDLQKCMQKPSTYQINALGEFHFPEKIAHVLFLGKVIGSKVLRCGTEKSLIYTRTFQLPAQFSKTFLAKCLRVNRALGQDVVASLLSLCMAKWLRKWRRGWLYVRSNTKNAKSLLLIISLIK